MTSWLQRSSCTKRELQSLAGKLQHACKVVKPGRTFLRRLFELQQIASLPHHHICLSSAFKSDLAWWHCFLAEWNGIAMLQGHNQQRKEFHCFTDASGHYGCGAFWGGHWIQHAWREPFLGESITPKELVPIVLACVVWGSDWQNGSVIFHSDNQAVVEVVNSGYSKHSRVQHLLRCLFFIKAQAELVVRAVHIPGKENGVADAISRGVTHQFCNSPHRYINSEGIQLRGHSL